MSGFHLWFETLHSHVLIRDWPMLHEYPTLGLPATLSSSPAPPLSLLWLMQVQPCLSLLVAALASLFSGLCVPADDTFGAVLVIAHAVLHSTLLLPCCAHSNALIVWISFCDISCGNLGWTGHNVVWLWYEKSQCLQVSGLGILGLWVNVWKSFAALALSSKVCYFGLNTDDSWQHRPAELRLGCQNVSSHMS